MIVRGSFADLQRVGRLASSEIRLFDALRCALPSQVATLVYSGTTALPRGRWSPTPPHVDSSQLGIVVPISRAGFLSFLP